MLIIVKSFVRCRSSLRVNQINLMSRFFFVAFIFSFIVFAPLILTLSSCDNLCSRRIIFGAHISGFCARHKVTPHVPKGRGNENSDGHRLEEANASVTHCCLRIRFLLRKGKESIQRHICWRKIQWHVL